jgi:hypothetical protein
MTISRASKAAGKEDKRTLHSPTYSGGVCRSLPESAGVCWSQILEYLGVTWAKLEIVVQPSLPESAGVQADSV